MSPADPAPPRGELHLYGLPLFLCLLSFGVGLLGDFALDDHYAILKNPVVTGELPALSAFTHTFWGAPLDTPPTSYRPVAVLLFRLDHAVFGLRPLPFHLTAFLTYALTVALGLRLSRLWLGPRPAVLAACLFAVLPVHAENVASLVGRADTLGLLFSLGALFCLRPALAGGVAGPARLLAAAALQILAVLSKESAAALPLITAALLLPRAADIDTPRRPLPDLLRRQVPALVLLLALLGYLGLRLWLIPATFQNPIVDDVAALGGRSGRLLYALALLSRYARLLLAPVDLCTGRKYAEVTLPDGLDVYVLCGAALVVLLIYATIRDLRRGQPPLWLCAALSYGIFSSLLFSVPEAMADRFLLVPTYFLCLPIGAFLSDWSQPHRVKQGLVATLVLLLAGASAYYSRMWRDTLTLLQHGVLACPNSVHNHLRLAETLSDLGQPAEAAWHFAVAAEGRRRFPGPFQHPAAEAEIDLPVAQRLAQLHRLLGPREPETVWRRALARMLQAQGRAAEAALVAPPAETSAGPVR